MSIRFCDFVSLDRVSDQNQLRRDCRCFDMRSQMTGRREMELLYLVLCLLHCQEAYSVDWQHGWFFCIFYWGYCTCGIWVRQVVISYRKVECVTRIMIGESAVVSMGERSQMPGKREMEVLFYLGALLRNVEFWISSSCLGRERANWGYRGLWCPAFVLIFSNLFFSGQ